ncbi:MAG: hypothetical protein ACYCV7_14795 [Acidimicrobiales bacterium]
MSDQDPLLPTGSEMNYADMVARIIELAEELTDHRDPDVARHAEELLDWVDVLHREGLQRLVEMARQWRGEIFLEAAAADPVAGALLAAYGLNPVEGTHDIDEVPEPDMGVTPVPVRLRGVEGR